MDTSNFFNAVILATAQKIARMFIAGDTVAATNCLEMHLGELDAANGAAFITTVQDFIVGKR